MKIGIITINGYNNFGNRLQNYATQEVLNSLGSEVETIVNTVVNEKHGCSNCFVCLFKKVKKMSIGELLKKSVCKIIYKLNYERTKKILDQRVEIFKEFTTENIIETPYVISKDNIPEGLADKFDYFIAGSDQVWNPSFRGGSPLDFLTFAPKAKRIAYSVSFGTSLIPDEFIENYKKWISDFEHLSVREQAGADLIKELTGRDSIVVVDPTLMLSKEKWLSVSKKVKDKPEKEYLLTYFIGKVSKENKKLIERIASENYLEIVRLADVKDKARFVAGPSEFIDYINSAKIVLTDSFHGMVFSILFEKPFIIFDRVYHGPSMNSRIDTLLAIFDLQSRRWDNFKDTDTLFSPNYSNITSIIESERNKALKYLKEALNIKSVT